MLISLSSPVPMRQDQTKKPPQKFVFGKTGFFITIGAVALIMALTYKSAIK